MNKLMMIYVVIRRWFMNRFMQNEVQRRIKLRKGKCNGCGQCCEFGAWKNLYGECCKHFDKETKKCKVYDTSEMFPPLLRISCKNYPFDKLDSYNGMFKKCGYYW